MCVYLSLGVVGGMVLIPGIRSEGALEKQERVITSPRKRPRLRPATSVSSKSLKVELTSVGAFFIESTDLPLVELIKASDTETRKGGERVSMFLHGCPLP